MSIVDYNNWSIIYTPSGTTNTTTITAAPVTWWLLKPAPEWQFGDMLKFRRSREKARFMFVGEAGDIDPAATDPIYAVTLKRNRDGWVMGDIITKNRDLFEKVPA